MNWKRVLKNFDKNCSNCFIFSPSTWCWRNHWWRRTGPYSAGEQIGLQLLPGDHHTQLCRRSCSPWSSPHHWARPPQHQQQCTFWRRNQWQCVVELYRGEDRDVFSAANVAQCADCLCGCSVGREGDYRLKVRRRVLSQPPSSTPADYTRDPPWAARRNVLWAAAEFPAWWDTLLTGMEDPDWREGGTVKYKCKYKYK